MLAFDVTKSYGEFTLRLEARVEREWLVLLAPSGAGKSVTLNCIAGLVRPDDGEVRLNGDVLFSRARRINVPIRHRRLGYVFQDYALFPHMTVAANIAYGLPPGDDARRAVGRWLELFHLQGKEAAFPAQLSGGQRQRVALARALASRPRALLLDEPLSALDRRIRENLQRELVRLKGELALPVVLVTHDFNEAQTLGDRVAVLEHGHLLEMGHRSALFTHPQRHETARFLGVENIVPARVMERGDANGHAHVRAGSLDVVLEADARFAAGDTPWLCIRAADVRLAVDEKARPNRLAVTVTDILPEGGTNRVLLGHGADTELVMLADDYVLGRYGLHAGSTLHVWLPPEKLFLCE